MELGELEERLYDYFEDDPSNPKIPQTIKKSIKDGQVHPLSLLIDLSAFYWPLKSKKIINQGIKIPSFEQVKEILKQSMDECYYTLKDKIFSKLNLDSWTYFKWRVELFDKIEEQPQGIYLDFLESYIEYFNKNDKAVPMYQ